MFKERRVKKIYNYKNGLVVMTLEDSNDAILFDAPRLSFFEFDNAQEAFDCARTGIMPVYVNPVMPTVRDIGERSGASVGAATAYMLESRQNDTVMPRIKDNSKTIVRHDDPDNFVPIESTILLK